MILQFILNFQNLFYRSYLWGFFYTLMLFIFKIFNALKHMILLYDTLLSLKLAFIIRYVLDHCICVHYSPILIHLVIFILQLVIIITRP